MGGKKVLVGIGHSYSKDPFKAAVEASKKALKDCPKPDISIVYTNASYAPKEFLNGVNDVLGSNWIGISTDKIFSSRAGYDPKISIAVLCISSDYMHFSISVADNYRKIPKEIAFETVKKAVEGIRADKYVDAYIQFTRTKKRDYSSIIRNPPYFLLTFISGVKIINGKTIAGNEAEFVSGLLGYTGPNIPIFGGSASSSLEDYMQNKADNYQFANGRMYKDAAIVVFVVCDLHFTTLVQHGYVSSKDFAAITKLDKTGYEILEINGKEPVVEYTRLLGVSRQEYFKDPSKYTFSRPFGLVQADGTTYVKEALPNKDGKTLHSNFQLHPNSIMNILKFDKKNTLETLKLSVDEMLKDKRGKTPALAFFCSCSGRRPLVKYIEKKDLANLKKKYPKLPFFGFYSFGEVGSTKSTSAQSHSQTITSLVIYDELLSE